MNKNFTPEQFLAAHQNGLTDRSMGSLFKVHHKTIAYYRVKYNLTPNGTTRKPLERVGGNEAKCSKCLQIKDLSKFSNLRKASYCQACRKAALNKNLNKNIESFLADRLNRLKLRCRARKWACTITHNELVQQFYNQNGNCFYTDSPLEWGVGNGLKRNSLSIDCVVREKGYSLGNVVLCTHKANTVKSDLSLTEIAAWLPNWSNRILKFLQIPNSQSS